MPAFRMQRGGGLLWPALFLLLGIPTGGDAESKVDPLAGIAARSYEAHTVRRILGASTWERQPSTRSQALQATGLNPAPRPAEKSPSRVDAYRELIERYSAQHRLDPDLVKAIITAESGGNPRAVSASGALGLMQLMPDTAVQLGVENVFDPEQNIASGTRYLRSLLDRFNAVEVALWAYNAGPRAVELGRMPAETEAYVPKVLRLRRAFKGSGN